LPIEFVKTEKEALEKAKQNPLMVILDLNISSLQPIKLITKLKSNAESKNVSVLGYVSHIQAELKMAAQEAGCDMVLARSAFSLNLQQILKRHAGIPA
jgi:CheY-like chemotaxis protein